MGWDDGLGVAGAVPPSLSLVFKLYAEMHTLDKKWSVSAFAMSKAQQLHAANIDLRS